MAAQGREQSLTTARFRPIAEIQLAGSNVQWRLVAVVDQQWLNMHKARKRHSSRLVTGQLRRALNGHDTS